MDELAALRAMADPERAARTAARHKRPRETLGLTPAQIDTLVAEWRERDIAGRVALADLLWQSDIHEARITAARLLTQARMRPDDAVWQLIASWVPDLDGAEIADAAMTAGQKRVVAEPARLDAVQSWLASRNPWARRAALAITLPYAKLPHPKPADLERRELALDWAAHLSGDPHGAIQQAIAGWLRDLARRDPDRVAQFLEANGGDMKPFAMADVARALPGFEFATETAADIAADDETGSDAVGDGSDQERNTSSVGKSVSDTPSS
ncbi:MAG: DNA alkylation repair protein [Paracoccus sp. (in: a-proteobacteria)]